MVLDQCKNFELINLRDFNAKVVDEVVWLAAMA